MFPAGLGRCAAWELLVVRPPHAGLAQEEAPSFASARARHVVARAFLRGGRVPAPVGARRLTTRRWPVSRPSVTRSAEPSLRTRQLPRRRRRLRRPSLWWRGHSRRRPAPRRRRVSAPPPRFALRRRRRRSFVPPVTPTLKPGPDVRDCSHAIGGGARASAADAARWGQREPEVGFAPCARPLVPARPVRHPRTAASAADAAGGGARAMRSAACAPSRVSASPAARHRISRQMGAAMSRPLRMIGHVSAAAKRHERWELDPMLVATAALAAEGACSIPGSILWFPVLDSTRYGLGHAVHHTVHGFEELGVQLELHRRVDGHTAVANHCMSRTVGRATRRARKTRCSGSPDPSLVTIPTATTVAGLARACPCHRMPPERGGAALRAVADAKCRRAFARWGPMRAHVSGPAPHRSPSSAGFAAFGASAIRSLLLRPASPCARRCRMCRMPTWHRASSHCSVQCAQHRGRVPGPQPGPRRTECDPEKGGHPPRRWLAASPRPGRGARQFHPEESPP